MMDNRNQSFLRCLHVSGLEVFAWLTNAQVFGASDDWREERVHVFEDATQRGGGMIEHDVLVSDLEIIEEV